MISRAEATGPGARRADVVLAGLVLVIVGMMIAPLPTAAIDILIALNLTLGVVLLATALYMRDALSFAAFPTLILIATLYRLALNVASTRLILLQGDAGRVIEAFGSVVVRGDYAVGALVFVVITLIQFLVIARGAERVAEVGARFSLDAMPGKQLAIDAELRAFTMGPDAARAARRRLERESQLYGAMDGAMKFVKGDAIAGILITFVNFVGGVALGATARGLDVTTSLKTYGLLTIGDGLVTQIPSLLGSTAAALAVTRVASDHHDGSLSTDIAEQLFSDPRVLWVGALVVSALSLVPGIPAWPFATLGLGCALLAVRAANDETGSAKTHADALGGLPKLELTLSRALGQELLVRGRPSAALRNALSRAAHMTHQRLGLRLPEPAVATDATITGRAHRVRIRGVPGTPCDHASRVGTPLFDAVVRDLVGAARRYPESCLAVSDVQHMLDRLERDEPGLVRRLPSLGVTVTLLTQLLRDLVREGVNVRTLPTILEALDAPVPHGSRHDTASLVERVRLALARHISHDIAPMGALHVLRLDPILEETLLDALSRDGADEWLALPPELAREIHAAIVRDVAATPEPRALVTTAPLRRHVRGLVEHALPELAVLSALELGPDLELTTARVINA